ncbi:MAG: hypothetical protein PHX44_05140 [Sulfurimonas sp.]|nr:hypothetical protein [Sulfurimonas sp.]MDD2652421.1 hypothetical protein [Sulfurimonas sp.]MDD3451103.1 hypothetical protein [Sulfurimonas sp.]
MADFTQPVSFTFIASTIAVIFAIVGIGVAFVKLGKKSRNQ